MGKIYKGVWKLYKALFGHNVDINNYLPGLFRPIQRARLRHSGFGPDFAVFILRPYVALHGP